MAKRRHRVELIFSFFISGLQKSCLQNSSLSVRMWGKMILYSLMTDLYKNVS